MRRFLDGAVLGLNALLSTWSVGPGPAGHRCATAAAIPMSARSATPGSPSAIRTAANTEAKLLMLTHAFEVWNVLRVCLHTDARNQRSQAAIERIGGKF